MTLKEQIIADTLKATPPVGVSALSVCGLGLSDLVLILTGVYTVLMIFFLIRDKWWRDRGPKD